MKQTKKERTQKEIIDAAKGIIHEKGHEAVTVRYLAEVTVYSYTNLYYYFKDMNAFLWTLRLEMIEDMITELTSVSITKEDPVEEFLSAFFFIRTISSSILISSVFYFYPFVTPDGDDCYKSLLCLSLFIISILYIFGLVLTILNDPAAFVLLPLFLLYLLLIVSFCHPSFGMPESIY